MKKQIEKITLDDYVRAVKKADRELSLQNAVGFRATTQIHRSKKHYNRKESKKIDFDTLFFCTFAPSIFCIKIND